MQDILYCYFPPFSFSSARKVGSAKLLKSPLLHRSLTVILLLFAFSLNSNFLKANSPSPKVLPREVAEHFGDLYILYNNRICPLQTFARDFTIKLTVVPHIKD